MARRQAGDAEDVIFSFERSRRTIRSFRPITATSSRRRRPASARSHSPSTAPATANCRRSSVSSMSCRSIGGRAPTRPARSATSPRPRWSRRSAAAPIGSRSSRPAAASSTSACKDYWGKDLNVNIGRDNFDELRFEYFRDYDRRARSVQGRRDRLAHREQRQELGDRLRLSRRCKDRRVLLEEFPIRNSGGMQAFAFNIRRDEIRGSARAPRLQLRASISRR